MKFYRYAIALALGFSISARAEEQKSTEAQTKMKIEETKEKNKVDGDIDTEITNAKLRAESGSKSKWSLSTPLRYQGGAINNGFGQKRPNLNGQPGTERYSSASVDPSVRYRWTKNNSVTLGTSLAIVTPFQGKTSNKQFNVRDPGLSFSRVGKLGDIQTNGSITVYVGTSNESLANDNQGTGVLSYSFLKAWDRLSLGTSFTAYYNKYKSKPGANQDNVWSQYGGDKRDEWDLGIYPFLEYAFNDTYSFRTVFGYFNWQHYYGDANKWRALQTYVYQSVGVGVSVSRDIHLYPNVQFLPAHIASDRTNVAMTVQMNMF